MTQIKKAFITGNKPNEVVSVRDFGAVGDGITDDTVAIQAAINESADKTLDLTGANIAVSSTVNLISNITIRNGTITQIGDAISCLYGNALNNVNIEDTVFVGKSVTGAPSTTTVGRNVANQAIKLIGKCSNVRIRRNTISGFENHGIYLFGSDNTLIEGNHIHTIGARNSSVDTPIDSATFATYSGSLSCLYIDGNSTDTNTNLIVRFNKIHGCLNTALSLVYAKDIAQVYGNEIYDSDSNAFQWGTGCESVKCHNNYLHSLTGYYDPTIEGYALSIHQEGHHSELYNNTIQNCKRGGINTKGSDYVVISGNYLRNVNENGNFGAIVSYGSFNRIESNTLYDCEFNAIHVSSEYSQITNNKIDFSSLTQHSAIVVNTTYNGSATDNLVDNNTSTQAGLLISIGAPNTICKNNKKFAFYTGVTSTETRFIDNEVSEYRASGGGSYGIRVSGSGAIGIIQGGINTATNKYQAWASGVVYIAPPTDDFRSLFYGSAAPTSGAWLQGDVIYNQSPTAGGTIGWVCTTSGTPGTWKTFGTISA